MKLQLYKSDYVTEDFVKWLLPSVFSSVLRRVSVKKLLVAKKVFIDCSIQADPKSVILAGMRCLTVVEHKDCYTVEIKPRVMYGSTHRSVKDLCSLIEYGNMNNPGSYLFRDAFQEVEENLSHKYSEYMLELI